MGDVEEMIGQLEDDEEADEEDADPEEKGKDESEEETAFGLDLDQAWSSPERDG